MGKVKFIFEKDQKNQSPHKINRQVKRLTEKNERV